MRILLIEDDEKLCEAVRYALEEDGYTVDVCHEGDDGLRWMRQRAHDLVLLDRMLPRLDGVSVLRTARGEGIATPVLLVTALGNVDNRVEGLDAGADDYLVKPFAIKELLARVRAMHRRPRRLEREDALCCGDICYLPLQKELWGPAGSCTLSKREGELLESLLQHQGQTMPRSVLLARVWGPDAPVEEGNLDNYIHFLRRRLRAVGSALEIETQRGVGYRLEEPHV